jgi:peptide/nickel transport system substrate-binding protein
VTAAVAGAALALTACSGSGTTKPASNAHYQTVEFAGTAAGPIDSFSWALYAEPGTLDWAHSNTYPNNTVLSNICESLLRLNPDLTTSPALASKVDHPDDTTYVYTIRDGVKFHDGTTMTADDVAYSLNRNLDKDVGSYVSVSYGNVASITATAADQVTVKLTQPDSLFNTMLATPAGTVESKSFLEAKGKDYGSPSGGVDCTGPFALDAWHQGSDITLKAFDGYWDKDLTPKSKQVVFKFYEDPSARVTALKTGEVDGNFFITPGGTETLANVKTGKLYYGKNPTVRSLMTWHLSGPLKDPRIRKALSIAIDRQQVIDAAFNGAATPALSPVSPDAYSYAKSTYQAAYDKLGSTKADIAEAQKLVKEAGAPSQAIVVASSPADPSYNLTALAVQAAGKAIGLKVEIKTLPIQQYNGLFNDEKAREGIDLYSTTWNLDVPDPLEFFGYFAKPGAYNNFNGYDDADYKALAEKALAATSEDERAELTTQLQKKFVDDTLWIPLFNVPVTVFQSSKIAGTPTSIAYLDAPWAAYIGSAK